MKNLSEEDKDMKVSMAAVENNGASGWGKFNVGNDRSFDGCREVGKSN